MAACTSPVGELPSSLHGLRMKVRTSITRGKMYPADAVEGQIPWHGKKGQNVRLAVQQRYRSCLVFEFRKNRLGLDKTPAFAVLWLQGIPDEQEVTTSLPIFGGDNANLKRAESNCERVGGEQIGTIAVTVKFWRGLDGYHRRLASNNPGVQDILEVLNTARDSQEVTNAMVEDEEEVETDSSSSSSGSEEDSGEDSGKTTGFRKELKAALRVKSTSGSSGEEGNGRGPLRQLREYTDHRDQLHQHHRGLMQWKVRIHSYKWPLIQVQPAYRSCRVLVQQNG